MQQEKISESPSEASELKQPKKIIEGVNYDYSFESDEARRQICYIEKQNGAICVKAGEYEEALTHYSKALMALHYQFKSAESKLTEEEGARLIGEIEIPCNQNMALCYFNLEAWEGVVKHCDKVLELDSMKIKALYRRGVAHTHLGNLGQAASDIKNGLKIEPKNEKLLEARQYLEITKQRAKEKEAHFYKTMFKKEQPEKQFIPRRSARVRMPKETLGDVVNSFISYAFGKAKDMVCCPCRTAKSTGIMALQLLKPSTYGYLCSKLKGIVLSRRKKQKRN